MFHQPSTFMIRKGKKKGKREKAKGKRQKEMTISRRTFLGHMAAGVLIAGRAGGAAANRIARLGVQLYTVRDLMAKDFEGTLAKVAAIGYKEVEFAGYFNHSPQDVKAILDRHGLTAPSTHVDYASLGDPFAKVVENSATMGHRFIVNPWIDEQMRKEPDVWKRIAATFNRAGEVSRTAGIQFAYHNHHFEFVPENGTTPMDVLLKECDPNLVKIELDLCWTTVAGQDPLALFQRYPGRFPLVHVKGLKKVPEGPAPVPFDKAIPLITDVGRDDIINWKRIFAQSEQAGIRHYFVEHDQPPAPLESLDTSAKYLRTLEF
jgi:sugar phosphate isomerase/epimerase